MAAARRVTYTAAMDGESPPLAGLRFVKMHGLGNDFVVIDARGGRDPVTPALARALGDRNRGVGFDQLAVIRDGLDSDATIDFWNADGSGAAACGNATRCVARLLMDESGATALDLRTGRGVLRAEDAGGGLIRVNMGQPQQRWDEVPLARSVEMDALPIEGRPSAVGMGNPHCVFVVEDAEAVDLAVRGPRIEHDPLFPERTNVEFVHVVDPGTIRMRVWERGGVATLACGSGACAAAVVTARRGLTGRRVTVRLDGGELAIDWREDGVWMTGPSALVFEGRLSPEFVGALRVIAPRLETFGCRLNAYESEAMKRVAAEAGLGDAVIVNTCAVTAEAVRQARQAIRRLRREDPSARIVVTGCAAQTEPATFAAMPEVDQVLGNAEKLSPKRLERRRRRDRPADFRRRRHGRHRRAESADRRAGDAGPGLRAGAERLRPPLHLLRDPLWPGQLAQRADGGGGRADRPAGRSRLQRGGPDRRGHDGLGRGSRGRAAARGPGASRCCAAFPISRGSGSARSTRWRPTPG